MCFIQCLHLYLLAKQTEVLIGGTCMILDGILLTNGKSLSRNFKILLTESMMCCSKQFNWIKNKERQRLGNTWVSWRWCIAFVLILSLILHLYFSSSSFQPPPTHPPLPYQPLQPLFFTSNFIDARGEGCPLFICVYSGWIAGSWLSLKQTPTPIQSSITITINNNLYSAINILKPLNYKTL